MADADISTPPFPLARWRIVTVFVLGVIGLAAAIASLYASPIEGVTDLGCGRVFDCSEALGSEWGAIAGIPLGVLGGVYFVTWMALLAEFTKLKKPALRWGLTWTCTIGAAISLFLLGILTFAIEGSCLYCLVTHAANLGAIALLWPARKWCLGPGEFRASLRNFVLIALLALIALAGLHSLYLVRVAAAEHKAEKQTIW